MELINSLVERIDLLKQLKATLVSLVAMLTFATSSAETFEEPIVEPQLGAVALNFSATDLNFVTSATKFATTTDEQDREIKIGIRIPITYDYPVDSKIESVSEDIEMNFGAYNKCRGTKTRTVCQGELDDDITQNIATFKINKERDLKELQSESFINELSF